MEKKSNQNISEEKSLPNKIFQRHYPLPRVFLRNTSTEQCLETNPHEKISEKNSLSLPNKNFTEICSTFSLLKKHCLTQLFSRDTPTEKCFKKKTPPEDIRRELSHNLRADEQTFGAYPSFVSVCFYFWSIPVYWVCVFASLHVTSIRLYSFYVYLMIFGGFKSNIVKKDQE